MTAIVRIQPENAAVTLERTRNHILVGFSVSTTIPYWRLAKLIAATESFGARHDLRGAWLS